MNRHLAPILAIAAVLAVAGCASRSLQYTLVKGTTSQSQLIQDEQLLRDTSGVKNVIIRHDSTGGATLELYVDENNKAKGLQTATDLGYQQVRN